MNTLSISSPFAHRNAPDLSQASSDPYATAAQSAAVLRSGAQYRRERMEADDMITTDDAALLAGASRVTINAWIKSRRCIGVSHLRRGFKLPRWQFEPNLWPILQPLALPMAGRCSPSWRRRHRPWTARHRAPHLSRASQRNTSWHWQRLRLTE